MALIENYINGEQVKPKEGRYLDVTTPWTGDVIARVALSSKLDIDLAVTHAQAAFPFWSALTFKARAQIMFRLHALIEQHRDELAELIVKEHGKTKQEALASIDKGNETVEFSTSMPQVVSGKIQEVSRGITCQERRDPLGVVVSIVPFNFPIMVPMWTIPIALSIGNCLILKPSEKVPLTMNRVVTLFKEAGLPDGVLQIVNGTAEAVEHLCDHPSVRAVTFVGTTAVAEKVAHRCRMQNKRALALGGAKNHLIAAPDCNVDMTSTDVVVSFSGCAGQRCMAASVLLLIGEQNQLIEQIVKKTKEIKPGSSQGCMGPVIDQSSKEKILYYINLSEKQGATVLVDGRTWSHNSENELCHRGFWVGPTVLLHHNKSDDAMKDEIFGPVLSIYQCSSKEEALDIEHSSKYGNAAAIYTSSGAVAEWFTKRFSSGMMGVNIGIPVPREPFSFGGIGRSKFGDFDITADGGIEFFTERKKITTKWGPPLDSSWLS